MTSPSTLIRQAKATKDPKKRKALRAQAAKLRRDIRNAKNKKKAPSFRRSDFRFVGDGPIQPGAMVATHDAVKGWSVEEQALVNRSVIPAPLIAPERIKELRKLAFKRKGDGFEIGLRGLFVDADKRATERLKGQQELHRINVVSGFMARVQAVEKLNGGPLPPFMAIDGYTVARVYDALRDAGYSVDGRDSGFRRRS